MAIRPVYGLSLCSGVGGLDLAMRLAIGPSYRTICYVEREAYCAASLVAAMEAGILDQAPIWDDLATFDGLRWRAGGNAVVPLVAAYAFRHLARSLGA